MSGTVPSRTFPWSSLCEGGVNGVGVRAKYYAGVEPMRGWS